MKIDRNAIIEECAKVLDKAAADWRRIRDPGMANNAASYAKQVRALKEPKSPEPKPRHPVLVTENDIAALCGGGRR
jgi:hypothetical protein